MIGFVLSGWLHSHKALATKPLILTMLCMYQSLVVSLFPAWCLTQLLVRYPYYRLLYWVFWSLDQICMHVAQILTWVCFL